jgi:fatty acid desaturase
MATKSRTAGGKPQQRPQQQAPQPRQRPRILSRSTVLPAAGIGVVAAIVAVQDGAPWPVAVVVAVTVALVVIGMLAIKRGLYGD